MCVCVHIIVIHNSAGHFETLLFYWSIYRSVLYVFYYDPSSISCSHQIILSFKSCEKCLEKVSVFYREMVKKSILT